MDVDLLLGDYQAYEVLKDQLKRKYGELLEEQTKPDKSSVAQWKDEESNVIQLIYNAPAFSSPHLRVSYINTEIDGTIERAREDLENKKHKQF